MKLSTVVPIDPFVPAIDYDSNILLLGSCFTENMGRKLQYYGFQTHINPFGIIFNPVSLSLLIQRAVQQQEFTDKDAEDRYSFLAHSDLNGTDRQAVVQQLNSAREQLFTHLKNSTHVFITLGTAWVYKLKENQQLVANCHQQPQKLFDKALLSLAEIETSLKRIQDDLKSINKNLSLVFTLSPVRHLKDGFIENNRSKSRLQEAILQITEPSTASYFPAYEIVMDELRDYRFYARDMVHLNELGTDYVWSRFRESAIDKNTQQVQNAVGKYRKLAAHKPKNKLAHQEQVQRSKEALLQQHPKIIL